MCLVVILADILYCSYCLCYLQLSRLDMNAYCIFYFKLLCVLYTHSFLVTCPVLARARHEILLVSQIMPLYPFTS